MEPTIRWRRLRRTPLPQRRRLFSSMRSRTWWHLAMGERLGRVTFPLISGRAFLHCFLIIFQFRWRRLQSEPGHNIYVNSMNIRGCAEESRRFVRAGLLWWSFVKMKRYNWNHYSHQWNTFSQKISLNIGQKINFFKIVLVLIPTRTIYSRLTC